MISFISGTLLKEEPCWKFMLKYDIENSFQQLTKTLLSILSSEIQHTELVMCNYVWLNS